VSVSTHPLHIARSSSVSPPHSNKALHCGTRTQPWLIEAPAGQRISIDLFDFSSNSAVATSGMTVDSTRQRDTTRLTQTSNINSCTYQYGYIIDKSMAATSKKNESICTRGTVNQRLSNVYVSKSSSVELVLAPIDQLTAHDQQPNFLIKIEGTVFVNLV